MYGAGHYSRAGDILADARRHPGSQALAGAGGRVVKGTLTATQANHTLAAVGGLRIAGALSATQANQTLLAAGKVTAGAAL